MTDDRERARAVLNRYPDATGPELLGALALDPSDEANRALVADLTGESFGDADGRDDEREQRTFVADGGRPTVESHGEPRPESVPVALPCKGPACDEDILTYLTDEDILTYLTDEDILTYLTDEDVEARETVRVLRYTPESDGERLVRYWFCSPDCRAAFVEAAESGVREETIYDAEVSQ